MKNFKLSDYDRLGEITPEVYSNFSPKGKVNLQNVLQYRTRLEQETKLQFIVAGDELGENFILCYLNDSSDFIMDISGIWSEEENPIYMVDIWRLWQYDEKIEPQLNSHYANLGNEKTWFWLIKQLGENLEIFNDEYKANII